MIQEGHKNRAKEVPTLGERIADRVAEFGGSWTFIITFLSFMLVWISVNTMQLLKSAFDPYPFILLNLLLSCLAALQAPVIMMSQNRQEAKDRERAKQDFEINQKAEAEIRTLHHKLDHLSEEHRKLGEMLRQILRDEEKN